MKFKQWIKDRGFFYGFLAILIGFIIWMLFIQAPETRSDCLSDCAILTMDLPEVCSLWDVTENKCVETEGRFEACYRICMR